MGIKDETSEMVLRLINAGAVIVGKTKTAQFASGKRAGDWSTILALSTLAAMGTWLQTGAARGAQRL